MKKYWKDEEYYYSERLGGQRQIMSGAGPFNKGDVVTDDYLIDVKRTEKKSYILKLDVLNKIKTEAFTEGRIPILAVTFSNFAGTENKRFVVVELEDFLNKIGDKL